MTTKGTKMESGLETKFCRLGEELVVSDGTVIAGYASLFGACDQGGDVVQRGAYADSLGRLRAEGRQVKMLWQHDPARPIGIWDEVHEDARGLHVKGRILESVEQGREAAALIAAGAIDGLSIGYRTRRAARNDKGQRLLTELELWEVSLVTFPMLPSARVGQKGEAPEAETAWRELAAAFDAARLELTRD
ncbi:HK97 family phage prohead protease [Lutimaribacter sp. EGI FJ00015]|uniref:HK97 family phage prohead protease n=1 Tax=Lutimaribacter degradans TaxID=2945989 RepID=A0ACC5ZSL9_9RHOB|nr:HK97 family phage prohead protease [Lutimaribacter sp. EGI FJ00013]MCM2561031.1 HK97 family phage prohead protease [Lutimaribacter sp. EGI FJ00013]MCO0612022.1 HK97 family phage prohead protease [Lutimaribacter sp. EGI FJ00015]MCO0634858.1 HK97 family phage prohead protease [Lutimaribacter sp. EGI FJ00014]